MKYKNGEIIYGVGDLVVVTEPGCSLTDKGVVRVTESDPGEDLRLKGSLGSYLPEWVRPATAEEIESVNKPEYEYKIGDWIYILGDGWNDNHHKLYKNASVYKGSVVQVTGFDKESNKGGENNYVIIANTGAVVYSNEEGDKKHRLATTYERVNANFKVGDWVYQDTYDWMDNVIQISLIKENEVWTFEKSSSKGTTSWSEPTSFLEKFRLATPEEIESVKPKEKVSEYKKGDRVKLKNGETVRIRCMSGDPEYDKENLGEFGKGFLDTSGRVGGRGYWRSLDEIVGLVVEEELKMERYIGDYDVSINKNDNTVSIGCQTYVAEDIHALIHIMDKLDINNIEVGEEAIIVEYKQIEKISQFLK